MVDKKNELKDIELNDVTGGTDKPHISIIVPTYTVEKWLPECIDNLINQTLKGIEIICPDD